MSGIRLVIAPKLINEPIDVPVMATIQEPIYETVETPQYAPFPTFDPETGQPVLDGQGNPVTEDIFIGNKLEYVDTGTTRAVEVETGETTPQDNFVQRIVGDHVALTAAEETAFRASQDTPAEHAAKVAAEASERAKRESKMAGVEILGVMCSATEEDQNGLNAVATGVTMARAASTTFPDTEFKFENGNSLVITDSNFDQVYGLWVPFRQSFFQPS